MSEQTRPYSCSLALTFEVDRLRPGEASGPVERHRLLNLVDQIPQRTRAPFRKETLANKRRSNRPFERLAVTFRALRRIKSLPARRLRSRVPPVGYRSRPRSLRSRDPTATR